MLKTIGLIMLFIGLTIYGYIISIPCALILLPLCGPWIFVAFIPAAMLCSAIGVASFRDGELM